jgi:hypothetical protein
MSLSDREILQLNELCGALVDGTLTEAQRVRLDQLLRDSEAARRAYVRAMGQSASLHSYAAEMHADAPQRPSAVRSTYPWWRFAPLAAAAVLALVFWWFGASRRGSDTGLRPAGQFVAQVTAAKEPQWRKQSSPVRPGTHLRRGEKIELISGFAEITFDSGARVVLEGAGVLEINSAWAATLRNGTLKASVPPEAIGFRVSNPVVDVVDLGTEFTMIADGRGGADVLVLKGEVEAAPRMAGEQETILLREKESRRFEETGVSAIANRDEKFARFAQTVSLERIVPANSFLHWSFDESAGVRLRAEAVGMSLPAAAADMLVSGAPADGSIHPDSERGRALQLDGKLYAKGNFPGLSGAGAHTIAFWVKVPEDAQLFEAYTIVAWGTSLAKLSYRPVQISWNRRREEGPLGALRTDFGGGWAVGTTSLRDGRWHHVAVYFAGGDDPAAPVQVKQYVDGRLESSTINLGKTRASGTPEPTLTDVVWLGRRLTGSPKYPERFRGEIDELFITARGLEPNEIVALMKDNQLPSATVAASR